MSRRGLVAVTAGLTQPSSSRLLADRLLGAAAEALRERGVEAEVTVVELREHGRDIMNAMLSRAPTGGLREMMETVTRADGLIVVTPVFNGSYSGLFKSFFDVLEPESLAGKPVLVAATGGTPRHSLVLEHALRPMFSYLRAVVVPTAVYAASEDWGAADGAEPSLPQRIDRAAAELADLAIARQSRNGRDPLADLVPFERLLGGR